MNTQIQTSLLEAAQKAGAKDVTVTYEEYDQTEVSVRNRQVESVEKSVDRRYGLEVIIDGKRASVSFAGSNPDVNVLAQRAVDMAKASRFDETALIAGKGQYAEQFPDLDLHDLQDIQPDTLENIATDINEAAFENNTTAQCESAASLFDFKARIITSNGFDGGYEGTRFNTHGIVYARADTGMERDYAFSSAYHLEDLKTPAQIGALAAERAAARLGAQRVNTGTFPVIYDRRVSKTLIGHILNAANGQNIARENSWLLDSMGEQILPEGCTLIDDPTVPRRLGAQPFDDEGLLGRPLNIVENGVLQNWLLDLGSAKKLGLKSNGRAQRHCAKTPYPSCTACYLTPGAEAPQNITADIKSGLYITSLIGESINDTTGDYSRGASGFWIENGEITYPVHELTIAGNLLDMLKSMEVANDLLFEERINAPSILIKDMIVAGQS